jgi:hypothetical protein
MHPTSSGGAEPCLHYDPRPSRASRSSIRPSRGGTRATIVGGNPPREIRCECNRGADATDVFAADPDVIDSPEPPPAVTSIDGHGARRHHTPDVLLTHGGGEAALVAIKPAALAGAKDLRLFLDRIGTDVPRPLAQGVLLITDRSLGSVRVSDHKLLSSTRRFDDRKVDAAVTADIAVRNGAITAADLVVRSGLWDRVFSAVARSIAGGQLSRQGRGIEYRTWLWRKEHGARSAQPSSAPPGASHPYSAPTLTVVLRSSSTPYRLDFGLATVVPGRQAAVILERPV